jgi:outer membrane protein assembly factor BamB
MKNHFNSCVLIGDYLYGNDEGKLQCLDIRSGAVKWSTRGIGKGGLIAANGKLIILNDNGELAIAEADPTRYVEVSRAKILDGECWTQPALANGLIFGRSHEGNLVCLDVRKR